MLQLKVSVENQPRLTDARNWMADIARLLRTRPVEQIPIDLLPLLIWDAECWLDAFKLEPPADYAAQTDQIDTEIRYLAGLSEYFRRKFEEAIRRKKELVDLWVSPTEAVKP